MYAPMHTTSFQQENFKYFMNQINLNNYLEALALKESGHAKMSIYKRTGLTPYTIVNRQGAAGKWQITAIARRDIGYRGTLKQFLNDSITQKNCVIELMKKNKYYLQYYVPDYEKYIGKVIHGVEITLAGLLSACHLGGIGSVVKFLKYAHNARDCNNTSVVSYLKHFKNYNIIV
jgi:hypothetical protein